MAPQIVQTWGTVNRQELAKYRNLYLIQYDRFRIKIAFDFHMIR